VSPSGPAIPGELLRQIIFNGSGDIQERIFKFEQAMQEPQLAWFAEYVTPISFDPIDTEPWS
jgi:hypothetical protein